MRIERAVVGDDYGMCDAGSVVRLRAHRRVRYWCCRFHGREPGCWACLQNLHHLRAESGLSVPASALMASVPMAGLSDETELNQTNQTGLGGTFSGRNAAEGKSKVRLTN